MLNDTRPLVRSITCWALSRYSHWLVERARADAHANAAGAHANGATGGGAQLDAVLQALLSHVMDRNRKVQEAACSALATVEEAAGAELTPRIKVCEGVWGVCVCGWLHTCDVCVGMDVS